MFMLVMLTVVMCNLVILLIVMFSYVMFGIAYVINGFVDDCNTDFGHYDIGLLMLLMLSSLAMLPFLNLTLAMLRLLLCYRYFSIIWIFYLIPALFKT